MNKYEMKFEDLDEKHFVVYFDCHADSEETIQESGYVSIRQDDADKCFYVVSFDHEGNVLSQTAVPMAVREGRDEE